MEDIFISGYSGRFPNSNNVESLFNNLKDKRDCVSDSKRYPKGYLDLPDRAGHLNEIDKFDNLFFKMNKTHVEGMDIQIRLLLEVVYEAIVDSGLSIETIKNTQTGVYVGNCFSDYHNGIIQNIHKVNGYENLGSAISMSANKISYFFDLKGPSMAIDTACSSSLHALSIACNDIASGKIERAIVAGVSLNLRPVVSKVFQKYNMLSPDGTCYSFDDRANGYCRSETINAIVLQKDKGYVKIIAHGINSNGTTEQGITFPNVEKQIELFENVCCQFNIDKSQIEYIEAHGTGTNAGDNVEITALDKVYGKQGSSVYLGSIKSSIGHAEGASGLNSIIKCLMNYERGELLPNIYFENTSHSPILEKRFCMVRENTPFQGGYSVINNFGFGGTNAHVILAKGNYTFGGDNKDDIVKVFARTRQECETLLGDENVRSSFFESSLDKKRFPYFGAKIQTNNTSFSLVNERKIDPKLVYVYSGQGSNYLNMGKELYLKNIVFRETIHRLDSSLQEIISVSDDEDYEIFSLVELFLDGSKWLDKKYSSIGITSVQIGITNILQDQGFEPDFIIGHSMGEIACSYADNCLTEYQCMYIAYIRSKLVELIQKNTYFYIFSEKLLQEKEITVNNGQFIYQVNKDKASLFEKTYPNYILKQDNHGKMLFVSSTKEDILPILEKHTTVNIACYNSIDGLTLSGTYDEICEIETYLQSNAIFCKAVETDGIAYHSYLLKPYYDYLISKISKVIPNISVVKRSNRWLSTSDIDNPFCDTTYHTKNITGSVYFSQQIERLSTLHNGVLVFVEISPNDGMLGQIKRTRTQFQQIPAENTVLLQSLSKKTIEDGAIDIQKLFCHLWTVGVFAKIVPTKHQLHMEHRYKIRWNHEETWKIITYADFDTNNVSKEVVYDLKNSHRFLMDHVIQNNSLFPAMGHIYTIWQLVGLKNKISLSQFCIYKAVVMDENMSQLVFQVTETKTLSEIKYDIYYQDELVVSVNVVDNIPHTPFIKNENIVASNLSTNKHMFYGALSRYGYNYVDNFRMIDKIYEEGSFIQSANHWISLLDGLLQTSITNVDGLFLPTKIQYISIETFEMPLNDIFVWKNGKSLVVKDNVIIYGLETTLAPKNTDSVISVIEPVEFVPYHVTYKDDVIDIYANKVRNYLKNNQDFLTQNVSSYPYLQNVINLLDNFQKINSNDITPNKDEIFLHIISDLYGKKDEFLKNPLLEMSLHPLSTKLYEFDLICCIEKKYINYCCQIINENLKSFSLLELGTGTGGFLRRVYPQFKNTMYQYYASDILDIHDIKEKTIKLKVDINDIHLDFPVQCVIGSNILHCCENIENTLQNIFDTLDNNGFLFVEENISELPCYLWGCDKSTWCITDDRDYGLWNNHNTWLQIFENSPFTLVASYNNGITGVYLVKKVNHDVFHSIEEVKEGILTEENNIIINCPADGFVKSIALEPNVNSIICAYSTDEDNTESKTKAHDYALKTQLKLNVLHNDIYGSYRTNEENFVSQDNGDFDIRIEKPGNLQTLSFYKTTTKDIKVYYAGLNFKDVMLSYGKLKESPSKIQLGLEFSGIINNSDKVMGMGLGMFASSIDSKKVIHWNIPDEWSLEESAAIPCVYSTVYYALDYKCRMTHGESILIHAGAGGIGQAAIHLCLQRGLKVFTTCSGGKREFLKNRFGLHDNQIGNSRDNSFYDWIMKETQGDGVDIVLNSLSEEKLLLSLECVKPFGQFCEIGKYDILQNNKIGLQVMKNNVSFHVIDLSNMFSDTKYKVILHKLIQNGLDKKEILPLRIDNVFHYTEIDKAIRYMGGGNHIGKIVIDMLEQEIVPRVIRKHRFITEGTHLVTGGMGGFGVELAEWLVQCGATKVLLVGRTDISNLYQYQKIKMYEDSLEYVYGDITNEEDVVNIFSKYKIHGVWHLAMKLVDKLYTNMTNDDWKGVVNVKKIGAELLNKYASKDALFVCFSSISSLFGNAGQTNYSYGNYCMEQICRTRREMGSHGLAICWGPIDNIGYLAQENSKINKLMFLPQNIDDCLNDLHKILSTKSSVISCYKLNPDLDCNENDKESTSLIEEIIVILGLKMTVIEKMDKNTTLQELGMDSLQSVLVKNILKNNGVELKDVYKITLSELIKHG